MNPNLKELTRELRRQQCPPRVLQAVFERVDAERAQRRSQHNWAPMAVAAMLCIGMMLLFALRSPRGLQESQAAMAHSGPPANLTSEEITATNVTASLELVGQILLQSSRKGSQRVIESSAPSIQSGLKVIRETLTPINTQETNHNEA